MTNLEDATKKAPDGGWGWLVCLGSSLITLSLRSLDPSFGLLFHEPLKEFNVDSTGTSLIMSILDSIVNFSGLLVGPLLKKYSYRKVAFFGSLLSCTGLMLTSRADSMFHIICTYSILGGLGTGLAIASSFVALNTFFDKKRGQAVGFSMAGTTLAMMLVPQFIHVLLDSYGFRGAMLIIGACALHSTVGACLLRPLYNRNMKINKKKYHPKLCYRAINEKHRPIRERVQWMNVSARPSFEQYWSAIVRAIINPLYLIPDWSVFFVNNLLTKPRLTFSTKLIETDTLLPKNNNEVNKEVENGLGNVTTSGVKTQKIIEVEEKERSSYLNKIKEIFDLDLLKDGVYLNVIFGLSLYYVAESNFKLMTPFFLKSHIGLTNVEVASCLSITAFTDILARLVLPTIFDRLGFKKRSVFWIFCLMVGIGRSILAELSKGTMLIVTFVVIGFLRGATLVNLNLSVSESCSLKKLPSALGMFMVSKGICVVIMSPVIGYIRDFTESYTICIHVMTLMISITFLSWGLEFMLDDSSRRKSKQVSDKAASV